MFGKNKDCSTEDIKDGKCTVRGELFGGCIYCGLKHFMQCQRPSCQGYTEWFLATCRLKEDEMQDTKEPRDRQAGGAHYKNLVIQPIEYCQRNQLGAMESNVVKYVTRHKAKGKAKDIKKAIHMLEMLLKEDYDELYDFRESIN